jgi:hypothetical protein
MEKPKTSYNSELGEYVNNEKLAILDQYHTWKCYRLLTLNIFLFL